MTSGAPLGVRFISVVHFLLAGFWGLIALVCAFGALTGGTSGSMISISWTAFAIASVASASVAGGLAALGYGLFEGKTWARGGAIGLSCLAILAGLGVGLGLGDVASTVMLDGLMGSGWISVVAHGAVVAYLSLSEDVARYFRS
jgi:hypothetical protein